MSARAPLTARQAEILRFIQDATAESGTPPTLREIGAHFKIGSTNGVNDHIKALERKGWLARGDHLKSRTLRVIGAERPTDRVFTWDTIDPNRRAAALVRLRRLTGREWPADIARAMLEKLGAA